jgi:glycosyltransferase involved in cell wall biosynthesis
LKSNLRILILTPTALPSVTGNAITAERWRRSLSEKGFIVQVIATQDLTAIDLLAAVRRFQPDLIHAHHAFRAGRMLLESRIAHEWGNLPLVISPAGTDINGELDTAGRKEIILQVFGMARAIVAQGQGALLRLREILPQANGRIFQVPKSIYWLGDQKFDVRGVAGWRPGDFLFFLPAGIRPVKGNLECLMNLEEVYSARPWIRAVFAGPGLDAAYSSRFERQIQRFHAFSRWISLIPPESMRSAYEASDVVLNTSLSEGLSNALLEAMASGRPLLASDIPGNREPLLGEEGGPPPGLLFDPYDREEFVRQALRLIDNESLRRVIGEGGRRRAALWPSPAKEAEGLAQAYQAALRSS